MFPVIEQLPATELDIRHERLRRLLRRHAPRAEGLLVFSRVNLYHLAGTMANGLLWLPIEGEPALFLRRGMERARLESPIRTMLPFRSYSDLPALAEEAGQPLPKTLAVEMNGLSWSLGQMLQAKLGGREFLSGDQALIQCRAVKTEWELNKMILAGQRHHHGLHDMLPGLIRPGVSEREVSHLAWKVFFELGHSGLMRMQNFGEEIFLGHVSAGESANYPSTFNGPVGLVGEHPAIPFMGNAGVVWKQGQPMACDIGFCLEGYQTDKTQVYWAGPESSIPDEVRRGHDFCVEIQHWLAERLKPGAIPAELYAGCMDKAVKAGLTEGFMALDANKVVFLGHGIGLAIDEYPVIAKPFTEPLEENMVMALEPKFGVRGLGMVGVENTFLITPEGGRCLTGDSFEMVCVE